MSEPNGTETGAEVYTDASGSFDSQALFGLWTGTYAFTVNKFSSGNVLQSCSTVVVGDHEK